MVRRFRYPIGIMALRGNGLLGDQHQEVLALSNAEALRDEPHCWQNKTVSLNGCSA
jgi:hypothetical protein